MLTIAHSAHWIVDAAYMAPVAGFLLWLGFVTVRQRRQDRLERAHEQHRSGSQG